ncbi:MAG: hypothetical protein SGI90_00670 [Candidatus Eisenbacteria bacterium]|nr:hypothetical protein [Candidatus Eisenbacteria bacterium]
MTLTTPRMRSTALLAGALALAAGAFAPVPARAQFGKPNEDAKIILHVAPTAGGRPCTSTKARARCDEMKVNAAIGANYYAFVCVVDGQANAGIAGVQFGVKFRKARNQGVDISEWKNCGDLQFPSPPGKTDWYNASNGGNLVTWDPVNNCQRTEPSGAGTGVTAVVGYFYVGSYNPPDRLEITVRPNDGLAKVAACNSVEAIVAGPGAPFRSKSYLGFVEFSDGATVAGSNPCGLARPVVESTWTGVKNSGR